MTDVMSHRARAELEQWRQLVSLLGAAHVTQSVLPRTWVDLVFGRIVTSPWGSRIPSSLLASCTYTQLPCTGMVGWTGGAAMRVGVRVRVATATACVSLRCTCTHLHIVLAGVHIYIYGC